MASNNVVTSIALSKEMYDTVKALADKDDRSIGYVIRAALKDYLEHQTVVSEVPSCR